MLDALELHCDYLGEAASLEALSTRRELLVEQLKQQLKSLIGGRGCSGGGEGAMSGVSDPRNQTSEHLF